MKWKIALALSVLLSSLHHAEAQTDSVYITGANDTLHYTYTPLVSPTRADTVSPKKNFFRRVVDYFGESTVDHTFDKKIDITFAGGPSYSKNTNFGIGGLAAGLYRIDRTDSITPPSDVSIFASVSVIGVYSFGVSGNNIFPGGNNRISYEAQFSSVPTYMWGIGYGAGRDSTRNDYTEKVFKVQARYLHRVAPDFFVGGMLNFHYTDAINTDERWFARVGYQRRSYAATGIGAILDYDSRDFIPNPSKGIHILLEETILPKGLGDTGHTLWRTVFSMSGYQRLWKSAILAGELYGEQNSRGMPWPMLARLGGSYRMRGYYEGRYTDRGMLTLQVELRQHIWRRIGCVAWGGAGNVFAELKDMKWRQTLPNYGIGLRWELKKLTNVRIDYGFGKDTNSFLLSINEAF